MIAKIECPVGVLIDDLDEFKYHLRQGIVPEHEHVVDYITPWSQLQIELFDADGGVLIYLTVGEGDDWDISGQWVSPPLPKDLDGFIDWLWCALTWIRRGELTAQMHPATGELADVDDLPF